MSTTGEIFRAYRYRLYPTPEQESLFRQFSGVCRLVYNLALEQRRDFWRQYRRVTGSQIGYVFQCRELTALRASTDWIEAVPNTMQNQALRDLDKAFGNFFRGKALFPKMRRKIDGERFRYRGREAQTRAIDARWSEVRIPKIGWVRYRDSRPILGQKQNVTISRDALGWHVSFACAVEHEVPANELPAVGIDRGIANTLTLSTGEMLSVPASLDALDRRHRAAQRVLARRKRGSKRRARQLRRCASLSARRARIRLDWHHKAALGIAKRFGVVVLEDLKIANMTASAKGTAETPGRNVRQKAGLNRSILNQGWGIFDTILDYKLEERGGRLVKNNPAYSSQECSECGCIDPRNRKSQAVFGCVGCGSIKHADHNAAIVILSRNTASERVEGTNCRPGEARTRGTRNRPENPLIKVGGRC